MNETLGQSRIIEEYFDTMLLFCALFFSLVGIAERWNEEIKLRCAEHIVSGFLSEASAHGYVTVEEYEQLKKRLLMVDASYQAECGQILRLLSPVYEYQEEAEFEKYYAKRNIRKAIVIKEDSVLEEKVQGSFQEFDNASLLSGSNGILYVPLPEEALAEEVEAVIPEQKVYTGETLVTLCRISRGETMQYVEAEPIALDVPGTYKTELLLQGKGIGVFLTVTVYQRTILCDAGHSYANTKERIAYYEKSGVVAECPYCAEIPEQIKLSEKIVYTTIGTPLSETGLSARVYYKNGQEETVLPGCDKWQDNYDSGYYGMQLVTVCYKGRIVCELTVITKGEKCKNCGRECRNRCYIDYKELPFCNRCLAEIPVYTGTAVVSEYMVGEEAFFQAWETEDCYILQKGSSLWVTVKNLGERILTKETVIRSRAGE